MREGSAKEADGEKEGAAFELCIEGTIVDPGPGFDEPKTPLDEDGVREELTPNETDVEERGAENSGPLTDEPGTADETGADETGAEAEAPEEGA